MFSVHLLSCVFFSTKLHSHVCSNMFTCRKRQHSVLFKIHMKASQWYKLGSLQYIQVSCICVHTECKNANCLWWKTSPHYNKMTDNRLLKLLVDKILNWNAFSNNSCRFAPFPEKEISSKTSLKRQSTLQETTFFFYLCEKIVHNSVVTWCCSDGFSALWDMYNNPLTSWWFTPLHD